MKKYPPVFILSSERSGSNLLRKLVTQYQCEYFGPSPAHFLKHLYYRVPYYGALDKLDNFKDLVSDALQLCYVHFSPWDIELTVDEVVHGYQREFDTNDVVLLSHYLMSVYAAHKGYTTYICKDNYLYEFVLDILWKLPEARFIYLYRDPRDYALSQFHRRMITDSYTLNARLWDYEQTKCIKYLDLLGEKRVYQVSYESLIKSDNAMRGLCDFLGVEYIDAQDTQFTNEQVPDEWKNLHKPVLQSNAGKYRKQLTVKQLELVEFICGRNMEYLGYNKETTAEKSTLYSVVDKIKGQATYFIRTRCLPEKAQDVLVKQRIPLATRLFVRWRQP